MAQMLSIVTEHQEDWDVHFPHVKFPFNNAAGAAMGHAPNQVHVNRLRAFRWRFSTTYKLGVTRVLPALTSSIATVPLSAKIGRSRVFERSTCSLS